MNRKIFALFFLALCMLFMGLSFVSAKGGDGDSDEDIELFGLELEKLVILINALLATLLFILTFIAYKRDNRKRLLYVSLAFFLFAIKSFLLSSELFFPETNWIDPVAVALEFAILLSFFYGLLKK